MKSEAVFNARESEQGVIGCLMADAAYCAPILRREGITPGHFADARYGSLSDLLRDSKPMDDLMLLAAIERANIRIDRSEVTSLRDCVPSAYNLEYYLPALKEAYARRLLRDAGRKAERLAADPGTDLATASELLGQLTACAREHSTDGLPEIVSAATWSAEPLPDMPEVISGILHKQSKLILSGSSKAGKTWMFVHLAICTALGREWLGHQTAPGRVLYLNTELSPRVFQKRLMHVCRALSIDPSSLTNLDLWHLRNKPSGWSVILPKIEQRVQAGTYNLIIVDPLYRLYGELKENSAEDMGKLTSALGSLAETTGAAVAIAAHHSKGNQSQKESIDRISGSGVIARDADALMDFSANEVEDCYSVSVRLRDFAPMPDFGVRWQFPLFVRDEAIDPSRLKQAAGRPARVNPISLLAFIHDRSAENPISVSEWAALSGTKRQTLSEYLPKMRLKGWIATMGEGMRARQYLTPKGQQVIHESEVAK